MRSGYQKGLLGDRARAGLLGSRARVAATMSMSIAVHIGLIYALWTHPEPFGVISRPSDAVSENLQETVVLEAMREEEDKTAPSEAEAISEPVPEAIERREADTQDTDRDEPEKDVAPEKAADLKMPPRDDPEPEVRVPVEERKPPTEERLKVEPLGEEPKEKVAKKQTKPPQSQSAPSSRSARAGTGKAGATSASAGAMLTYASRIRAKIATNKPRGIAIRGRVMIEFGVSTSGGLTHIRVSQSSGVSLLDQAAVSAVRRAAPFGQPPSGMSPRQLTFAIPIQFQ
jgi:protein TonB